jgi:hypothetical protein
MNDLFNQGLFNHTTTGSAQNRAVVPVRRTQTQVGRSVAGQSLYPAAQVFDLRNELKKLFYGDIDNPGIAQSALIRRLQDEFCECWNVQTNSADDNCRYCQGEGHKWIETLNHIFLIRNFGGVMNPSSVISRQNNLTNYGYTDENRALAYTEYDCFPNYERYLGQDHPSYDKLYELKVDFEGKLVQPLVRTIKWKMRSVTPHRGDFGRIEYFELGLEIESV